MGDHYDVLIENTTIVDGAGNPRLIGSVGIRAEKFVSIAALLLKWIINWR
ncbi:MAG: hypothetical protein JXA42_14095 [Anaerolineales bacterium]|nr:hypothetical protein [Anaerolineales bacterium]